MNEETAVNNASQKVLVAFFSHSGNTRYVAEQMHSLIPGSDLFEIKTVREYSQDYDTVLAEAKAEKRQKARPELATHLANAESYDVVILAYPSWWGTYPMAVATFLEESHFSGKTLVAICTHEGSKFGDSIDDLSDACPDCEVLEGIEIRGRSVRSERASEDLAELVMELKL